MLKEYDTTKIKVTPDYGEARCICGGKLNHLRICSDCHAQYSIEDTMFWVGEEDHV